MDAEANAGNTCGPGRSLSWKALQGQSVPKSQLELGFLKASCWVGIPTSLSVTCDTRILPASVSSSEIANAFNKVLQ